MFVSVVVIGGKTMTKVKRCPSCNSSSIEEHMDGNHLSYFCSRCGHLWSKGLLGEMGF